MKDRIKKFYKDHEEAIFVWVCATAGATAAALYVVKKTERMNAVCCLGEVTNPNNGVHIFEVFQVNGKKTVFDQSDFAD